MNKSVQEEKKYPVAEEKKQAASPPLPTVVLNNVVVDNNKDGLKLEIVASLQDVHLLTKNVRIENENVSKRPSDTSHPFDVPWIRKGKILNVLFRKPGIKFNLLNHFSPTANALAKGVHASNYLEFLESAWSDFEKILTANDYPDRNNNNNNKKPEEEEDEDEKAKEKLKNKDNAEQIPRLDMQFVYPLKSKSSSTEILHWNSKNLPEPRILVARHSVKRDQNTILAPGKSVYGKAAFFLTDAVTPINFIMKETLEQDLGVLEEATESLLSRRSRRVLALTTFPAGGQVGYDYSGNCSYLNYAMIVAQTLVTNPPVSISAPKAFTRVGILNCNSFATAGTQVLLGNRSATNNNIFYASVHADPALYFPYNVGYEQSSSNNNNIQNAIVQDPSDFKQYRAAVQKSVEFLNKNDINALIICISFNMWCEEGAGPFRFTNTQFGKLGKMLHEKALLYQWPVLFLVEHSNAILPLEQLVESFFCVN